MLHCRRFFQGMVNARLFRLEATPRTASHALFPLHGQSLGLNLRRLETQCRTTLRFFPPSSGNKAYSLGTRNVGEPAARDDGHVLCT